MAAVQRGLPEQQPHLDIPAKRANFSNSGEMANPKRWTAFVTGIRDLKTLMIRPSQRVRSVLRMLNSSLLASMASTTGRN